MVLIKKFNIFILIIFFIYLNLINIFANETPVILYYETPELKQAETPVTNLEKAIINSKLKDGMLVKEGKHLYLNLIFNNPNNIKNLQIHTKDNNGNYKLIDFKETKEGDMAEYKFKINDVGSHILVNFYTSPFGRNVNFYLNIDESKLIYVDNADNYVNLGIKPEEEQSDKIHITESNELENNKNSSSEKTEESEKNENVEDTESSTESQQAQENEQESNENKESEQKEKLNEKDNKNSNPKTSKIKKSNKAKISTLNINRNKGSNLPSILTLILIIALLIWVIIALNKK